MHYATEYDTDFTGRPHKPGEDGCVYYEVIHVLKRKQERARSTLCVSSVFKYKKSAIVRISTLKRPDRHSGTEELDYPMSTYTDLFYAERLVKVSEITWEHCKRIYEPLQMKKITF